MREQLHHLCKLAAQRNVTLQVLPFDAGGHGAMHGAFQLLKFSSADDPDKVYLETQIGGLYTQKADEVTRYALLFDHLRAQALSPGRTVEVLNDAAVRLA